MKTALVKKQFAEPVDSLIRIVRGQKVMLDSDIAQLYDVETKALNRAVKRNPERFPVDIMFQLTENEAESLRCQIGTLNKGRGQHRKYTPYVFTEHGVVMLSSVLNSPRAIQMSLLVVRTFVRMREILSSSKDIANRIEKLEQNHKQTDSVIETLIEDIEKLSNDIHWIKNPPLPRKYPIGFVGGKAGKK